MNESKAKTETKYVVLQCIDNDSEPGPTWVQQGTTIQALNDQAALKKAGLSGEGPFVAVPARSWHPRIRKVEQVTRESWS